jgi:hypothetical protein
MLMPRQAKPVMRARNSAAFKSGVYPSSIECDICRLACNALSGAAKDACLLACNVTVCR